MKHTQVEQTSMTSTTETSAPTRTWHVAQIVENGQSITIAYPVSEKLDPEDSRHSGVFLQSLFENSG